jgi:hypothetical protein
MQSTEEMREQVISTERLGVFMSALNAHRTNESIVSKTSNILLQLIPTLDEEEKKSFCQRHVQGIYSALKEHDHKPDVLKPMVSVLAHVLVEGTCW